jgi:hypothetical protein
MMRARAAWRLLPLGGSCRRHPYSYASSAQDVCEGFARAAPFSQKACEKSALNFSDFRLA